VIRFRIVKSFKKPSHFRLELQGELRDGTFLGVSGPSGSGKSTLLRCLAGLERPDEGFIRDEGFGGNAPTTWFDSSKGIFLPPQKRRLGVVFQDYALFPHLTVLGNVLYATADRNKAKGLLELTRMDGHGSHFPRELSGGQKQRVALARALAREPDLLLLDEPLSALDEELREELGEEIRNIQKSTGVTALMVSHSKAELDKLCDQILCLRDGRAHEEMVRPVSPSPYPPNPSSSSLNSLEATISSSWGNPGIPASSARITRS